MTKKLSEGFLSNATPEGVLEAQNRASVACMGRLSFLMVFLLGECSRETNEINPHFFTENNRSTEGKSWTPVRLCCLEESGEPTPFLHGHVVSCLRETFASQGALREKSAHVIFRPAPHSLGDTLRAPNIEQRQQNTPQA